MPHAFKKSGYIPPARADRRNFPLEKAQAVVPFPTSFKVDLSSIPVFHQHDIPDCVENAIVFVKKYHDSRNGTLTDLSRRFLACITVEKDGFPLEDGTSVQNALYLAYKVGICESTYLQDNHELDVRTFSDLNLIPKSAYDNAATHKVYSYAFATDLSVNGLKNAIHQNGLVVVGAIINQNWWTSVKGFVSWLAKDILPIRPPTTRNPAVDTSLSGHCFVLYGYDEQYFYFVNSFGTDWADKGTGYFGVNEVPFIYEAATIIDLLPSEIETLKEQIKAANEVVSQLDPKDPTFDVQVGLVKRLITLIISEIKAFFGRE